MKRTGLLAVAFCVLLTASAAMAWLPLKDVPHEADVDSGTHLV